MSEQTSNPTSGQNVPKSKFRRKSRQEQTAASKLRMERRCEKLDAAREKLVKQKPPKKPGAVKRLAHTAGHGVHGFVHGKLYEVEHENVGTEGAHRSELAAESVYRFGRRKLRKAIREHPAKAVERAESKHIKATADYYYRKTVEEHPEMQEGGTVSRYLQKQKIKRQYAKQVREAARQTAKAAEGTASVTGKLTEKVSAYIKEHPGGLLLLLATFLLLVVLQSCMSSLVTVGNGVAGAISASTYAAEDADLLGAEAAYCALEDELQHYLDTYTRTHDYLHVMVTPEEQALIADRMAEAGISNMGAYMRKMALNGYVLHVDLSDIRELVALQRRCANNLNQVAVHANTYGIYPSEIAALQKDYAALWEPLSQLIQELSELINL